MEEGGVRPSWANRTLLVGIFELVGVGDREGVREAVRRDKALLEAKEEEDGAGTLHWAVRFGREDIVRILVELGANMEAEDRDGETPLLYVARTGAPSIIKLLVEKGARLSAVDQRGRTALHRVAERGREGALEALVSLGADVDAKDVDKRTPLHLACARAGGRTQLACVS